MQQTPRNPDKPRSKPRAVKATDVDAQRGDAEAGDVQSVDAGGPARVISLAMVRNQRVQQNRPRPALPELEELDLRGVDLDRMTAEAREHYWFQVNKYARHLYVSACDLSMSECDHPYSPVCVQHVRDAEMRRIALQRGVGRTFGLPFVLDGLQILGAAACGALATRPTMFSSAGVLPLAVAMTLTIAVFLWRETLAARDGRL